ncbi:MAG: hypothetical protein FJW39_00160 [Acidobacteria bacterium]|nr:hypothetical protein [Acidobacteriota bacterium]
MSRIWHGPWHAGLRPLAAEEEGDATRSIYPAYPVWLTTREMARIGLLMSRGGEWNGKQVVARDWVRTITSLVTPVHYMNPPARCGYGAGTLWGSRCGAMDTCGAYGMTTTAWTRKGRLFRIRCDRACP